MPTFTIIQSSGETQTVTVPEGRRVRIDASGGSTTRVRRRSSGETEQVIEGGISDRAREFESEEQLQTIAPIEDLESAAQQSFARTSDIERGRRQTLARPSDLQTIQTSSIAPQEQIIAARKAATKKKVQESKMISAAPPTQSLLVRAGRADIEGRTFDAALLTGRGFVSSVTEGDFRTAGQIIFPDIQGEQLKLQTGKIGAGLIIQQLSFKGLGKFGGALISKSKQVFGAKTIVGPVTGTGKILSETEKKISTGAFSKQRVLLTPIEEAKKSRVVIQQLETLSFASPTKGTLIGSTKGIKAVVTGSNKKVSQTVITSKDLSGKILNKEVVDVTRLGIPGSKKEFSLIKISGDERLTERTIGITSKKVIRIDPASPSARFLTQEVTRGPGFRQKVTFGEKLVVSEVPLRRSTGFLENRLLTENILRGPKIRPSRILSPTRSPLPVTGRAGISRVKPLSIKGFKPVFLSTDSSKIIGVSDSSVIKPLRISDKGIFSETTPDIISLTQKTAARSSQVSLGDTPELFRVSRQTRGSSSVGIPQSFGELPVRPTRGLTPIPVVSLPFISGKQKMFSEDLFKKKGGSSVGIPPSLIGGFFGVGEKVVAGREFSGLGVRR